MYSCNYQDFSLFCIPFFSSFTKINCRHVVRVSCDLQVIRPVKFANLKVRTTSSLKLSSAGWDKLSCSTIIRTLGGCPGIRRTLGRLLRRMPACAGMTIFILLSNITTQSLHGNDTVYFFHLDGWETPSPIVQIFLTL